ncbi:MAG: hypothetical protein ABW019_05855, partial [Chitinophagaceae bacterium]
LDKKLNNAWLKNIINSSDSAYSRPYYRSDFVTASYYINKKDSTLAQVMRDSAERVRQVIVEKNGVRSFSAQFYPTGYAITIAGLNPQGQFHGQATFLYADGRVKSKGQYENGFYSGVWETYSPEGKLVLREEYGPGARLLKTTPY